MWPGRALGIWEGLELRDGSVGEGSRVCHPSWKDQLVLGTSDFGAPCFSGAWVA